MGGFFDDPMGGALEDTDEEHLRLFMRAAEGRHFPKSPPFRIYWRWTVLIPELCGEIASRSTSV
jgi:hypothetical protein